MNLIAQSGRARARAWLAPNREHRSRDGCDAPSLRRSTRLTDGSSPWSSEAACRELLRRASLLSRRATAGSDQHAVLNIRHASGNVSCRLDVALRRRGMVSGWGAAQLEFAVLGEYAREWRATRAPLAAADGGCRWRSPTLHVPRQWRLASRTVGPPQSGHRPQIRLGQDSLHATLKRWLQQGGQGGLCCGRGERVALRATSTAAMAAGRCRTMQSTTVPLGPDGLP